MREKFLCKTTIKGAVNKGWLAQQKANFKWKPYMYQYLLLYRGKCLDIHWTPIRFLTKWLVRPFAQHSFMIHKIMIGHYSWRLHDLCIKMTNKRSKLILTISRMIIWPSNIWGILSKEPLKLLLCNLKLISKIGNGIIIITKIR